MSYVKGKGRVPVECAVGNLKVGPDTLIMNITSGTDCESLKKGLCQVPPGMCYAIRAEQFRPDTLPYRRRQTKIWDTLTAEEIADQIKEVASHRRKVPIKYLRLQESGDFRNQADVDKASQIARLLKGVVKVYTYTARRDLDYKHVNPNLVINGSGFKVSNQFKVVDEFGPGPRCRGIKGGGCFGCSLCKENRGLVIQELLRGGSKGGQRTVKAYQASRKDTGERVPEIAEAYQAGVGEGSSRGKSKVTYRTGARKPRTVRPVDYTRDYTLTRPTY